MTLRCSACRRLVTQEEADEANEIHPSENTHCHACAAAFAEGEDETNTAGEPA